jgi:hypothetical protein
MLKSFRFASALLLGSTTALALTACGSSASGNGGGGGASSTNFTALRTEYTAPSGSLASSDVLSVGKQLGTLESQSDNLPTSTQVHVVSGRLHPMDTPISCNTATASSGTISCTCNGGGTFDETFDSSGEPTGDGDEEGTIQYKDCALTDTSSGSTETDTITGSLSYADYTTAPEMLIYSGSISETVTPPGTTTTVDFNFALVNGALTYSVSVADGTVLVSDSGSWDESTQSGTFTVTDKSGSWTCTLTNGSGTCTGSSGSLTI